MSLNHHYFVYITTNRGRTVLYTGITNDLRTRLEQHREAALHNSQSFTGRYKAYHLIYFEYHRNVNHALEREKEIKGWRRSKKIDLLNSFNPEWRFLNDEV